MLPARLLRIRLDLLDGYAPNVALLALSFRLDRHIRHERGEPSAKATLSSIRHRIPHDATGNSR